MAEPFVGEIKMVGFNFSPRLCPLQRAASPDRSEHRAVLAPGDDLRGRRPDDVRPAGPPGPGPCTRATGLAWPTGRSGRGRE